MHESDVECRKYSQTSICGHQIAVMAGNMMITEKGHDRIAIGTTSANYVESDLGCT